MNLECLNTIIADNLAIHIDLTNVNSWLNWNVSLNTISLTKWNGAITDYITLRDFGLTGFDTGKFAKPWYGSQISPNESYFNMNRVGYSDVFNPTTGETSGITFIRQYLPFSGVSIISGTSGNYFYSNSQDGGYLRGYFKLQDYNYELFPQRYNYGITIETVLNIFPNSEGIFYMMGARSEDKYNPLFSGETFTGNTASGTTALSGVTTSDGNYLDALIGVEENKIAFSRPEDMKKTVFVQPNQIDNLKNNVIAFGLTLDKRLKYEYIDGNGLIVENISPRIMTATGFTMIDIVFTPDAPIDNPDPDVFLCAPRRTGKLVFYVNGRANWTINEFPEFFFHDFDNQKEKVLGVPYTISWGGGSFGLKYAYHYDYQTYVIYNGQNYNYINTNFSVYDNPLSGSTALKTGLSLSADTVFYSGGTVMSIVYTGGTGGTGNSYFIKFNNPVSILSNRDYVVELSIYDNGFSNGNGDNTMSILGYSNTTDISIMESVEYQYPVPALSQEQIQFTNTAPFAEEYEYVIPSGEMFYGATSSPVFDEYGNLITEPIYVPSPRTVVTGQGKWWKLKSVIRSEDNTGQKFMELGLLIESTIALNPNAPLYIKDFTYTAADILIPDPDQDGLIQDNFGNSFLGGIQKLRIYDNALTSTEVLHNALIESLSNPDIRVTKGGRLIYR